MTSNNLRRALLASLLLGVAAMPACKLDQTKKTTDQTTSDAKASADRAQSAASDAAASASAAREAANKVNTPNSTSQNGPGTTAVPADSTAANAPGAASTTGTTPPADSAAAASQPRTFELTSLTPTQIKSLQTALNKQGANVSVDGAMSPPTREALVNFQNGHNLTGNGTIDAATLAALNIPLDEFQQAH